MPTEHGHEHPAHDHLVHDAEQPTLRPSELTRSGRFALPTLDAAPQRADADADADAAPEGPRLRQRRKAICRAPQGSPVATQQLLSALALSLEHDERMAPMASLAERVERAAARYEVTRLIDPTRAEALAAALVAEVEAALTGASAPAGQGGEQCQHDAGEHRKHTSGEHRSLDTGCDPQARVPLAVADTLRRWARQHDRHDVLDLLMHPTLRPAGRQGRLLELDAAARWRATEGAHGAPLELLLTPPTQATLETCWSAQHQLDEALSHDDLANARAIVRAMLAAPGLPDAVAASGLWTLALLDHAQGDLSSALAHGRRALSLRGDDADPQALAELTWWGLESPERDALIETLDALPALPETLDEGLAMTLAHQLDVSRAQLDGAADLLARVTNPTSPATLRYHGALLESMLARDWEDVSRERLHDALTRTLHARLAADPPAGERVALLLRLGRLYEEIGASRQAGRDAAELDAAAAEVYREALQIEPGAPLVCSALGRLLARRGEHAALVALIEHELDVLGEAPDRWRLHLDAARLYAEHLDAPAEAATHLQKTLSMRPDHLPAHHLLAEALAALGRHEEVVTRWYDSALTATSRRVQLLMLHESAQHALAHLDGFELAARALQKTLALAPDHPTAWSQLAALYEDHGQWEALLALHQQELQRGHLTDPEACAALCMDSAAIAEDHLGDLQLAEHHCHLALTFVSDYPQALSRLGRLLAVQGRWEELARQRVDRLHHVAPHLRWRALCQSAEAFERRLRRPHEAIALYRQALDLAPEQAGPYYELHRLLTQIEAWDELVALLTARADDADAEADTPVSERSALHAELAELFEWRLDDHARAWHHWRTALQLTPHDPVALHGVARTWQAADVSVEDVLALLRSLPQPPSEAVRTLRRALEERVMRRLGEPTRGLDAADGQGGDDSQATEESTKNPWSEQVRARLRAATCADWPALDMARAQDPLHAFEWATSVARHAASATLWSGGLRLMEQGDAALTRWLAAQLPAEALQQGLSAERQRALDDVLDDEVVRLRLDLARVRQGDALMLRPTMASAARLRLAALVARSHGDWDAYAQATHHELLVQRAPSIRLHRLIEWAELCEATDMDCRATIAGDLLVEGARCAFPGLRVAEADETTPRPTSAGVEDEALLASLYNLLQRHQANALHVSCIQENLQRVALPEARRIELLVRQSALYAERLDDLEAARAARHRAWELAPEDASHLDALVALCGRAEDAASALRYQGLHFESHADARTPWAERVRSGLRLVELLLAPRPLDHDAADAAEDDAFDEALPTDAPRALAILDALVRAMPAPAGEGDEADEVIRRELLFKHARTHARWGTPHVAARALRQLLAERPVAAHVEDWRALIRLHWAELDDLTTAHALQWTLVEHDPTDDEAVELLCELADATGALLACAQTLTTYGEDASRPMPHRLACWRWAAHIIDDLLKVPGGRVPPASPGAPIPLGTPELYERLVRHEPDPTKQSAWMRRLITTLSASPDRLGKAYTLVLEVLAERPDRPEELALAERICQQAGAHDRARIFRSIRAAVDATVEPLPGRVKVTPSRALDDLLDDAHDHLGALLPEGLSPELLDAFALSRPLLQRAYAEDLPQKRALGTDRVVPPEADDALDQIEPILDALGLHRARFVFGTGSFAPMHVLPDAAPLLWWNTEVLGALTRAQAAFLGGWAAALVWSGAPEVRDLDGRSVWQLFDATLLQHTRQPLVEPIADDTLDLIDTITHPLTAVTRRRLASALDELRPQLADAAEDASLWPALLGRFAARVGLVICGDLSAALSMLPALRGEPHAGARVVDTSDPLAQELMRFAMTDEFLMIRHALGLSGRPSTLR